MKTRTRTPGITFAVHPVEPATKPLPTRKTHEAINSLLDRKVESCCDYTSDCIQGVYCQTLVNDRRLRKLCQLAGERSLVFRVVDEAAVRKALRELGYVLPRPR